MTRIVRNPVALAACFLPRLLLAVLVAMLLAATADAALTTSACLVQKRKAWITFRKCQGTAQVNQIKGKLADLAKCQTTFQSALAKITAKATKAVIPCRYLDNGNLTITDYDTGLQWEQKTDNDITCILAFPNCSTRRFTWGNLSGCPFIGCPNGTAFIDLLGHFNNCVSPGYPVVGFAGHCDWRLPTLAELQTILLAPYPCGTSPCIDPIFGPTVAGDYWSATTEVTDPNAAGSVSFDDGSSGGYGPKYDVAYVRAVRTGL